MKFSPTLTLAFVLATGMAGAAMAQSTATPATVPNNPQPAAQNVQAGWQPGQAHPSVTQPQADIGQTQPGSPGQAQAGAPPQPSAAQAQPNQMHQGQAASSANDQVRQAQQQLQYAGLYNGPVDGVMDPDTRAALARFQQQNGLRRTQDLDQPTMARLMSGDNTGSGTSAAAAPASSPNGGAGMAAPATGAGGNAAGQPMNR
jgi:peptidoglycan hydrolase-like protein with peptidoglycan-binding domain